MDRSSILGAGAALLLTTVPALAQTTQVERTATTNRPITLDGPSGAHLRHSHISCGRCGREQKQESFQRLLSSPGLAIPPHR